MAMRRLAFLLLFLPTLAFAANPATLETRSRDHSLVVDIIPIANDVEYDARVTDLHTGELIASAKFASDDSMAESLSTFRDMQIVIRVRRTYDGVSAAVEIRKDDIVVESMDTHWALKPNRRSKREPFASALHVGGDVKAPVVVSRVEPVYTEVARKARISGIVIVEALVDKNGTVRDVNVLKPLAFGLDQAAIDAVKQWKFMPALKNGEPVDVAFNLTVNFKLPPNPPPPAPAQ